MFKLLYKDNNVNHLDRKKRRGENVDELVLESIHMRGKRKKKQGKRVTAEEEQYNTKTRRWKRSLERSLHEMLQKVLKQEKTLKF